MIGSLWQLKSRVLINAKSQEKTTSFFISEHNSPDVTPVNFYCIIWKIPSLSLVLQQNMDYQRKVKSLGRRHEGKLNLATNKTWRSLFCRFRPQSSGLSSCFSKCSFLLAISFYSLIISSVWAAVTITNTRNIQSCRFMLRGGGCHVSSTVYCSSYL